MTTKKTRFKLKKFQAHKTKIAKAIKKVGGAEWDLAKGYQGLWTDCSSPEEFRGFLSDPADGLGLDSNKIKTARRMISALKSAPEKAIWERLGWSSGVSMLERVPKAAERKALHDEVLKRIGKSGRGRLSKAQFKQLLRDLAPSLEVKDSVQRENEWAARIKQLERENSVLRREFKGLLRRLPVDLEAAVSDEAFEILGTRRRKRRA